MLFSFSFFFFLVMMAGMVLAVYFLMANVNKHGKIKIM